MHLNWINGCAELEILSIRYWMTSNKLKSEKFTTRTNSRPPPQERWCSTLPLLLIALFISYTSHCKSRSDFYLTSTSAESFLLLGTFKFTRSPIYFLSTSAPVFGRKLALNLWFRRSRLCIWLHGIPLDSYLGIESVSHSVSEARLSKTHFSANKINWSIR